MAKREIASVGFPLASQRTLTERALECRQLEQSHPGIVLTFAALVALTLARVATAKVTSPNDMFVGSVQRGTRAYRNVQGTVYMTLSLGAHGRPGRFRLRFEGTRCPDETSCLALSGVVRGNATPRRGVPDSEGLLGLRGYGRVSLLGPVGLRGVIHDTDFVETGPGAHVVRHRWPPRHTIGPCCEPVRSGVHIAVGPWSVPIVRDAISQYCIARAGTGDRRETAR